jgi:uracil-DNA glycosylase family 4
LEEEALASSKASSLSSSIEACSLCRFVDKPLVKYEAYLRWLPDEVKVLAVGESPPPGLKESSLYNTTRFDRFRECMKLVLGLRGELEVLEHLKSSGVFVTAAVKCRPFSRSDLEAMRSSCLRWLEEELKLLAPRRVVALGRTASTSLSELLGLKPPRSMVEGGVAEAMGLEVCFTPHPNYVLRFRRDLVPMLRGLLLSP